MATSPRDELLDTPTPVFARPVQLGIEVASYVRELILSGQRRAGTQLNIDMLARDLGVSATPVREGLLALRGEGFVEFEPRRGFRVSPLSRRDIEDLYWVQSMVAGELAGRAAATASADLADELVRFQDGLRDAIARDAVHEFEGLNFEFHRAVNHAAASPKLMWLLGVSVRYSPRRFYSVIPGWVEASLEDHDSIIAAIRGRDATSSREAMTSHILHGDRLLVQNLERRGFWTDDDTEAGRRAEDLDTATAG